MTCGNCTHLKWRPGSCRPWCEIHGRWIPGERFDLGCKYWDDCMMKNNMEVRDEQTRTRDVIEDYGRANTHHGQRKFRQRHNIKPVPDMQSQDGG